MRRRRIVGKCEECNSQLEFMHCDDCNGSGEGYHDGTICTTCNGAGETNETYCPVCADE